MKFVLYTNSLSAHQLPLANEIVKRVGGENFRYVYTQESTAGSHQEIVSSAPWVVKLSDLTPAESADLLETSERLLVGGLRPIDLLEKRSRKGFQTFYQTERWFKPVPILGGRCLLPGVIRMLHPGYRKMARRFLTLINRDSRFKCLTIGPWAKSDFVRIGAKSEKLIDWGYFVAPSSVECVKSAESGAGDLTSLKVLYIGRLLRLKRIDTIIRSVKEIQCQTLAEPLTIHLSIVGDGPDMPRLKRLVAHLKFSAGCVDFKPSVPLPAVRRIMREHDVVVFASNATDGWGATVSEALEEGVPVIGTHETGASATLLPDTRLFHCGDYKTLAQRLLAIARIKHMGEDEQSVHMPIEYSAKGAAERMLSL